MSVIKRELIIKLPRERMTNELFGSFIAVKPNNEEQSKKLGFIHHSLTKGLLRSVESKLSRGRAVASPLGSMILQVVENCVELGGADLKGVVLPEDMPACVAAAISVALEIGGINAYFPVFVEGPDGKRVIGKLTRADVAWLLKSRPAAQPLPLRVVAGTDKAIA